MMKFLQKLGKALMLPVACLPICGILMGLGYALCPSTMQGGDVVGIVQQIGFYLVKAGGALIDNMAILFAIGIGVGMSEDNDGTGGLAALASWLMLTTLLSVGAVSVIKTLEEGTTAYIAFSKIANPFIGIIAGVIGSSCYNKFKGTKLPDWLSFFSGKRCVAIVAGVVSIVVSVVLLFVWPVLFGVLVALGEGIAKMGAVGAGIYAFFNRLLIPFGLHHALNLSSDDNLYTCFAWANHTSCSSCFDCFFVYFCSIFHFQTKSCDAVVDRSNVFFTAASSQNCFCNFCVVVVRQFDALFRFVDIIIFTSRCFQVEFCDCKTEYYVEYYKCCNTQRDDQPCLSCCRKGSREDQVS